MDKVTLVPNLSCFFTAGTSTMTFVTHGLSYHVALTLPHVTTKILDTCQQKHFTKKLKKFKNFKK